MGSVMFQLAVAGAHLTGLPLNHQLTELGARLVRTVRTAPVYSELTPHTRCATLSPAWHASLFHTHSLLAPTITQRCTAWAPSPP